MAFFGSLLQNKEELKTMCYRNRIKYSLGIGKYAEQCQKHMKYDMILADNAMKAILKKIGCDQ